MKKGLLILVFIFMSITLSLNGTVLEELTNPSGMYIDDGRIYIAQGTTVFIYSLDTFKFLKKFGKKGEGPGELLLVPPVPLMLNISKKDILITSRGKMSHFTKDGKFISETKVTSGFILFLRQMSNGFAGFGVTRNGKTVYRTINLYDKKLKKQKELAKLVHDFQAPGQGFNALVQEKFAVADDRVYVPWKDGLHVEIFDINGKKVGEIKDEFKDVKITDTDKKQYLDEIKKMPGIIQIFDRMKPFRFPDAFPAVRDIKVSDGKVYIFTFGREKGKCSGKIYSTNGEFIRNFKVSLVGKDIIDLYPFEVFNGKIYQLLENEDEDWELKSTAI